MSNCPDRRCRHEWCDRNRETCDALVSAPSKPGYVTNCGKLVVWRAPLASRLFPLSYCAEHAPSSELG